MKKALYILFIFGVSAASAQSLADYQKMAAENNPGLKAMHKEFEAALQAVPQVTTLPDPNLTVSAFGQMIETRVGPQRARFSLSQMFPWFGTLKARGDAASLMAEAKFQAFADTRNQLFYQVAAAYYPLLELEAVKALETDNIELLNAYKAIASTRLSAGSGTLVDVLRADLVIKSAETNLSILEKQKAPLTAAFNKLLGRALDEAVELTDSLDPALPAMPAATDSLFASHPLLQELELKVAGMKAAEYAAQKQGLPNLGFGLDYIIVGNRTDLAAGATPPADNGKDAIMPMVSVSLPVFRKKYRAAVKEAQVMQESYALQQQETANMLAAEYQLADFELKRQLALIQLYEQQEMEAKQMLNLLFTSYSNSEAGFDDLLDLQQQLLQYQKLTVEASTDYQTALARYNYLTAKEL